MIYTKHNHTLTTAELNDKELIKMDFMDITEEEFNNFDIEEKINLLSDIINQDILIGRDFIAWQGEGVLYISEPSAIDWKFLHGELQMAVLVR